MSNIKFARNILNPIGIDVARYPDQMAKNRINLMKRYGFNLVFDIGANKGQYAREIRRIGYKGKVVSFEPLSKAF